MKTPGQIAYEALQKSGSSLYDGPWDRLSQIDIDAWEAVAEAVRDHLVAEMGPASDRDW